WSWSSTTTGAWTQVSADTPPTPAVRYSFDEMPDLPDDSGADFKSVYFTAVPSDWYVNAGTPVSTFSNGIWHIECEANEGYYHGIDANRLFICNIRCTAGTVNILKGAVLASYQADGKWHKFSYYNVTGGNNIVIYSGSGTFDIEYIYIGDGTSSQPIIDNVSGAHNSTAQSGVVSTTGVSGKACKFLGYRAVQLDLSKYANVQSWWTARWMYVSEITDSTYVWRFGDKDDAIFAYGGLFVRTVKYISDTDYNTQILIPYTSLLNKLVHIAVATTITSSSTTKKVYLNGALYGTVTITVDNTDLVFDTGYIGGSGLSDNIMSGWQDDFCFGAGEITASEVLGLYLQRASGAKFYSLADYQIDNNIARFKMETGSNTFTRSRDSSVNPSSITVYGYRTSSGTEAYNGYYILKYSTDGGTYIDGATATGTSATLAIPNATVKFKVEMYSSSSDTTNALATLSFDVPYSASVKPQYLGIGLIADVNGLTTKAFTGATITDAGKITPGSSVSAVIPGDWIINYSAGTYRAKGIYYWSGSAWTLTSDSKYTSDGVIEDICRLNNGGILIPDWTVYVNLIADNLFSHKIKLTTKTISGVTYEGVFYGGERFNADGSIADRSKNGFYFKTDGKGWCNLQSDDLYNTIIGTNAGLQLISGSGDLGRYNSIYGMEAGCSLTSGYNNSLFGSASGYNITTGFNNCLFGSSVGYSLTTGNSNSLFGDFAGHSLTSGYNNCLFGDYAGYRLTSGFNNSVFGDFAGYSLTTGTYNCLLGAKADAYTGAWKYQINLNNRIMYLEFASDATQDTVYKALAHYIVYSAGNVRVGAMGRFGDREILSIKNDGDNNIDFYNNGDTIGFTAVSGSSTKIGYPLQVAFIMPAEPTNV
ncbi:MAG: hypothetical protein WCS17_13365, partial [Prevotella sp.]